MALWQRLGQSLRLGWQRKRDPLVDAELAVNQLVNQLQGDLLKLRQAVAEAIALQKRTERQRQSAQSQVDHWYYQAQDALSRGDEAAARAALERQWPYRKSVEKIDGLLTQRRELVQQLRATLGKVEQQVVETRNQRDLFVVRSRSAAATVRLRDALDTVAGAGVQALERFETQVQILEAQAELLQLGTMDGEPPRGAKADGEELMDEAAITAALAALEADKI